MATSTFNMITGREGRTLRQKWQDEGTKTFLGLHSHGFPNLFIVSGPQGGGGSFNFTDVIEQHGDYVVWMLKTMREKGARTFDVRAEAEDAYAAHVPRGGHRHRPPCATASPTTTAKAARSQGNLGLSTAAASGTSTASTPRRRWSRSCSRGGVGLETAARTWVAVFPSTQACRHTFVL